jgi:hypothetical protein
MLTTFWKLPMPSAALARGGPEFEERPGRELGLRLAFQTDAGDRATLLVFEGVEGFKTTYGRARGVAMLEAHERLLELGATPWLHELSANLRWKQEDPTGLAHLMINFAEGPCYEVICRGFRLEDGARPPRPTPRPRS